MASTVGGTPSGPGVDRQRSITCDQTGQSNGFLPHPHGRSRSTPRSQSQRISPAPAHPGTSPKMLASTVVPLRPAPTTDKTVTRSPGVATSPPREDPIDRWRSIWAKLPAGQPADLYHERVGASRGTIREAASTQGEGPSTHRRDGRRSGARLLLVLALVLA